MYYRALDHGGDQPTSGSLPDAVLTSPGPGILVVLIPAFVLPTIISIAICYSVPSTPTTARGRFRR